MPSHDEREALYPVPAMLSATPLDSVADQTSRGWVPSTPEDHASQAGGDPYGDEPYGDGVRDERAVPGAAELKPWRRDVRRWLATLNPGRTQREYEKAVGYFFETPGVPQALADVTFDLLLAYRGALALRATAHADASPSPSAQRREAASLGGAHDARLPGARIRDVDAAGSAASPADGPAAPGALAPATVNLRLTALRQFLVHCALLGSLPQLSRDHIRAALRRLTVERRRPYQVLAEPEWEPFLAAARRPMAAAPAQTGTLNASPAEDGALSAPTARGPWGTTRAQRLQRQAQSPAEQAQAQLTASAHMDERAAGGATEPQARRSRAGLTGVRTAQRDHALIALALATGLRAIELAALDVGDLSREWHGAREEWWLVLPDAKTKGQRGGRVLPLAPELVETLHAYLVATGRRWGRAADRATPLFLCGPAKPASVRRRTGSGDAGDAEQANPRGWTPRRLSPNQIRRIVDRVETQWLAWRAHGGIEGSTALSAEEEWDEMGETRAISPHALRHSTAIALLEGSPAAGRPPASVEHVRGWLGHFDIRTTQGYLAHLDSRRHRRPFTLAPGATEPGRDSPEDARRDQTPRDTR
jgi:integrase